MYAMRKSDLKLFTPDSQSVCRIEDGSTNAYLKEDRMIEEFLKTIEPNYNSALTKLIEGKIDHECIYAIAGFIAYVYSCSPTGMRIFSEPLKGVVETLVIDAEKRGLIPLPPEELGGARLAELLRKGDVEIRVDPKYPQAIGISSILRNVAVFGNFKWDVLLNRFDQNPFFTSDFPVAIEATMDWRVVNKIVPLAPNVAVRIRPDLTIDRKDEDFSFANFGYRLHNISHRELVDINRSIVRCAEDTVFYRDDLAWVQKFIARNRDYRIESPIRKRTLGKGTLLVSTHTIAPFLHSRAVTS